MQNIIDKFELDVLSKLDIENLKKIISFLEEEKIDYVDELLENYIDLFIIEYEEFKKRFNKLKEKYGTNIAELISEDLNILEEF